MKIVEYDSDSDEEMPNSGVEEKSKVIAKVSKGKEKKVISLSNLPIAKKLNFLQKRINYSIEKNEEEKNEIAETEANIERPTYDTLPQPKKQFKKFIPLTFQKPKPSIPEPSLDESEVYLNSTEDPLLMKKTDFRTKEHNVKREVLEDGDEFEQLKKIEPRAKADGKTEIAELSSSDLLDLDWKLHREKLKLKAELTCLRNRNLINPTDGDKKKNQLTYLAYQALRDMDGVADKKFDFRENHKKTQMKYGW